MVIGDHEAIFVFYGHKYLSQYYSFSEQRLEDWSRLKPNDQEYIPRNKQMINK